MPDYTGQIPSYLLDKTGGNLQSALSGELNSDVIDQLRNNAASFGVANGLAGSDFSGYRGLRNLGLTSMQRQDDATKMLTPFFNSPLQQQQFDLQKQAQQFSQNNYNRELRDRRTATGGVTYQQPAPSPYGGGGAAPGGRTQSGNYGNEIGDFISRYLPGAGGYTPMGGYGGGGSYGGSMGYGGNAGNLGAAGPVAPSFFNPGVNSVDLPPQYGNQNYGNPYDQGPDLGVYAPTYGANNYGNPYDEGTDYGSAAYDEDWY